VRRIRFRHPILIGVLLAAVVAPAIIGGCRGRRARASQPGESAVAPVVSPAASRGLEIEIWVFEDRGGDLARAIERFEEPATSIDRKTARDWRASGLRLVGVPAGELETLRRSLSFVAPVRQESLTEATRWRSVARGPRLNGETVVTSHGPAPLNDGWARLLARAWTAPSVVHGRGTEASMRLELVPQIVSPARGDSIERIEARLQGRAHVISEDGPVLRDLSLSAMLREGEALLVVGESPEADWGALAQLEPMIFEAPEQEEGDDSAPSVGPGAPEGVEEIEGAGMGVVAHAPARPRIAGRWEISAQPAGPGVPRRRTLGEAMLVGGVGVSAEKRDGSSILRAGRRAVIVIIPHVSGPYRLLPRVAPPPPEGR